MSAVVLIGLGGCVGALLRWAASTLDRTIPWGIITANVAASGAAAWLVELDRSWRWLVSVGVLGALSTWSTLAVDAVRIAREASVGLAATVLLGTATASVAVAWALLQI